MSALKEIRHRFIIIVIGIWSCSALSAQGMEDALLPFASEFGPGARAMALGGAYMPIAEDYTAVYWNPAGLAQVRKMEFYAGLSRNQISNRINYQGTVTDNDHGYTSINSAGLVFPIPTYRGSLVFAIGYHRINSFTDYNQFSGAPYISSVNSRFNQYEETTSEGGINQWSFAGAMDITENVSLGATLNLITGKNNLDVTYRELDTADIIAGSYAYNASFEVAPKFTGASFKIGSLFRPMQNLRVALTMTSPAYLSAEENSNYYESWITDSSQQGSYSEDSFRKYSLQSPWRFEIGAAYKYKFVQFSGSVEMINWTEARFSSDILDGDGKDIDAEINSNIRSMCRETANYRFGAEVIVPQIGTKLLGGYYYQSSPYKSSAEAVKSNRQYLSAGASFLLDKQVKIDFAYQRGWWNQSTTDNLLGLDDQDHPLYTREKITTNKYLVNFSYRF